MDLRQLRTFSCVAELGSLSKASDTLRVAQPALSRQIKLLEHELRAELFTRNGRGMVLTEAGRLLLARTGGIVRQIDQIRDDIQSSGGPPSGRVVLGLVPTVSCVLSARLARRTVESFPGIRPRQVRLGGEQTSTVRFHRLLLQPAACEHEEGKHRNEVKIDKAELMRAPRNH